MRLGIDKIKEIIKNKIEEKRLMEELQIQDLVNYGVKARNKAVNDYESRLHSYVVAMLRFEEANAEALHRQQDVMNEAKRLKLKLNLDRRKLFDKWKELTEQHKGEGVGIDYIYYRTAGLYIALVKKRG